MAIAGMHETLTVTGTSPTLDTSTTRMEVVEGMAAMAPAAEARDLGDLFEYRIQSP